VLLLYWLDEGTEEHLLALDLCFLQLSWVRHSVKQVCWVLIPRNCLLLKPAAELAQVEGLQVSQREEFPLDLVSLHVLHTFYHLCQ